MAGGQGSTMHGMDRIIAIPLQDWSGTGLVSMPARHRTAFPSNVQSSSGGQDLTVVALRLNLIVSIR